MTAVMNVQVLVKFLYISSVYVKSGYRSVTFWHLPEVFYFFTELKYLLVYASFVGKVLLKFHVIYFITF